MLESSLLSHIYTEELFIIEKPKSETPVSNQEQVKPVTEIKQPISVKESVKETPKISIKEIKKEIAPEELIILTDKEPSSTEKELLLKILSSVGLTEKDMKLMKTSEFSNEVKYKKLISFAASSPIQGVIKYEIWNQNVIVSDNLAQLENSKEMKMSLWKSMKTLFNK